jgi:hypothetical protein
MADGIPIYGPYGDKGVFPTDLDECNGHVDSTHGFYHYHITPNYKYPYLTNCLKGCISKGSNLAHGPFGNSLPACHPQNTQYDYTPFQQEVVNMKDDLNFTCPFLVQASPSSDLMPPVLPSTKSPALTSGACTTEYIVTSLWFFTITLALIF